MDQFLRILLLTFLSLLSVVTQIEGEKGVEKVKVRVFYETLCSDSKRFVKRQLYPLFKNGGEDHIDVEFIPYGKATTTRRGSSYTFTCQHGREECEGNKMHACALKYLTASEQIHFVGCSMSKSYPPTTLVPCALETGIDAVRIAQITSCSKTSEGDALLAAHGEKTHRLKPKLFFVPTVTFNNDGGLDEEKMWQSQNDLVGVVCSELGASPHFCTRN